MKQRHFALFRRRFWFDAHRVIGTIVALFVVLIAGTGLMLNHTTELQLDKRYVESDTVLNHYGIRAPARIPAYAASSHWISQWDRQIGFDTRVLGTTHSELRGAVTAGSYIVVALRDELWLLDSDGTLIERIGAEHGVPTPIERIGTYHNQLVVAAGQGVVRVDLDTLDRQPHAMATRWSAATEMPSSLRDAVASTYRQQQLSWERLVQDVHSGRILSITGVYVTDIAAVLLLLLAVSGLWLSLTRPGKRRRRQSHAVTRQSNHHYSVIPVQGETKT